MLNGCPILNCKKVTPGSVVLIQDSKIGCALRTQGKCLEKKQETGIYLELLCCWVMTIRFCYVLVVDWVCSPLWNAGKKGIEDERAGCLRELLVSFYYSPVHPHRGAWEHFFHYPFWICSSSDLETGLVGWLGNLRNLFPNNILRSLIICHLGPYPTFG